MINDTPLEDSKHDRLGFAEMAKQLASSFLQNDLRQGFVVGVEGSWGSGKSSLVNLALEELIKKKDGPRVIKFAPWLVGNRNELLAQLFADLQPAILEFLPLNERENTKKILGLYSQMSSGLAVLAGIAEVGGMPWAALIKRFFNNSSAKAAELSMNSLRELNETLRQKLELLEHPIIVFIDDLDRLESTEAAEVLRLVKAVADFPNVAYILAYDPDVLAKSMERAIGIENGREYLEKIVQASFKVPKVMNFDLRNWLKDEVLSLIPKKEDLSSEVSDRLEGVFHQWCGEFVETPRDVVRVLNSLRLNYVGVHGEVDPGDMVFLQIVRTKNSTLFNWIEDYVANLSAIGDWGYITPGSHERMGASLIAAIGKENQELTNFIYALRQHLPGLDTTSLLQEGKDFKVFSLSDANELRAFSVTKRLASPNHFSYYFSFSGPSGSISDAELKQFLLACELEPEKATQRFREMMLAIRPQGGSLAEVLVDRIIEYRPEISAAAIEGLFFVFGETLDELVPFSKPDYGYSQFLHGYRREVFGTIERISDPDLRMNILRTVFSEAKSIAWLSGIIRAATFEHSNRKDLEKERLISEKEFELIKRIFVKRLVETAPSNLLKVPYFLSLMYAWYQLGETETAANWIAQQTATDVGFLDVLDEMKSWSESSAVGVQYRLSAETLNTFFEGKDAVQVRLTKIASQELTDAVVRHRAKEMLSEI